MFRLHVCPKCYHVGGECICGELPVYYAASANQGDKYYGKDEYDEDLDDHEPSEYDPCEEDRDDY